MTYPGGLFDRVHTVGNLSGRELDRCGHAQPCGSHCRSGKTEILELRAYCSRSNRLRGTNCGTNCGGPLSRPVVGALGLLFLFPLFQRIVQGCDQLQQLFWILFATGSFAKLQPALILEVRHVSLLFDELASIATSDWRDCRFDATLKNQWLRTRKAFWQGLLSLSGGNFFPGRGTLFHSRLSSYRFPKTRKAT